MLGVKICEANMLSCSKRVYKRLRQVLVGLVGRERRRRRCRRLGFAILFLICYCYRSSHLFFARQAPEDKFRDFIDARSRKVCEVFMKIPSFWLRRLFRITVLAGGGPRGRSRRYVWRPAS